jgi:hypothetical protein
LLIATIAVGLDGTCMLIGEDGYREAMVGTVWVQPLFDKEWYSQDSTGNPY